MLSDAITDEYLSQFHYLDLVPLICRRCETSFVKKKNEIQNHLRRGRNIYCSRSCNSQARNEKHNHGSSLVICEWCIKEFRKGNAEIKKTQHSFCTKSCSAQWRNANKTSGYRRSKMEIFIEERMKSDFPELTIYTNHRKLLGLELDFYIPELKTAIEINGILHFQPIFGTTKLKRIQELDSLKKDLCVKLDINLIILENIFGQFTSTIGEICWRELAPKLRKSN